MPPASSFVVATNYLRVRGEYFCITTRAHLFQELPPRTRRILHRKQFWGVFLGTTSAYAENTVGVDAHGACKWNYLRVRGEYVIPTSERPELMELPPRTRRILLLHIKAGNVAGTTSAYAENTSEPAALLSALGNYLRVRGEYLAAIASCACALELPPRTRRIPSSH